MDIYYRRANLFSSSCTNKNKLSNNNGNGTGNGANSTKQLKFNVINTINGEIVHAEQEEANNNNNGLVTT